MRDARHWADEIRSGRGIVLVGPPGIGKTTLARRIAAEFDADAVLRVRATRSALDVPLGAYESLLPPDVRNARDAIAHLRARHLDGGKLVVLFVDDAHDLDDISAFVTLALASTPGVVMLCCRRTATSAPAAIDAMERDGIVRAVEIAPLDQDGVSAVAREILGHELASTTAARITDLTRGNPLFASELLAAGIRTGDLELQGDRWHWVGPWHASVRLTRLVEERLDALDNEARDLLELIALAEPAPLIDLEAVIEPACAKHLEVLERLALVDIEPVSAIIRVGHPLYGEVVRQTLPRTRLHRHARLLAALPTHGRPELEVRAVRWKLEAGVDVDGTELLDAQRAAYSIEDTETALQLAQNAIDKGEPVRGGWALAEARAEIGDIAGARLALDAAAEHARTDDDYLLLDLARSDYAHTHSSDRRLALALLDGLDARLPNASVFTESQRALYACLEGRPRDAMRISEPFLDGTPEVFVRFAVPAALSLAVSGRAREATAITEKALAMRPGVDADAMARLVLFATAHAFALVETGDAASALAVATHGHAQAQDAGATRAEAWFAQVAGIAELGLGHYAAAGMWFEEAAVRFGRVCMPAARWAWAGVALCAAFHGDAEVARTFTARAFAHQATCWHFLDAYVARANAWTHAAAGAMDDAVRITVAAAHQACNDGQYALEAMLAEDLVRFGAPAEALPRLERLRTQIDNPRVALWFDHAHAATRDAGLELLVVADAFAATDSIAEAADAYALAAGAYWRTGDAVAATWVAARARDEARRGDGLATPALRVMEAVPAVTDRQVQIAALAASGHTSREIAEHLVLSIRTIDNHLARFFRTFAISNRAELPPVLAAWRPDAAIPDRGPLLSA